MKKFLLLFAIVLFAATSCTKSKAQAELLIAAKSINAQCPMVVSGIETLKKVQYELGDWYFVYYYTIDEDKCPMSNLKSNIEAVANTMKSVCDNNVALNKILVDADVKILHQYYGEKSGEVCCITYDPKNKSIETN